jgi:hypothetical protein
LPGAASLSTEKRRWNELPISRQRLTVAFATFRSSGPEERGIATPKTVDLEQEAVPHAAIPKCANHFYFVKTLWEP